MADWRTNVSRSFGAPGSPDPFSARQHSADGTTSGSGASSSRPSRREAHPELSPRNSTGRTDMGRDSPERRYVAPLEDLRRQPVVKLHQTCTPRELGLDHYSGRKVRVSRSTMEILTVASEVLRQVKHLFPFGAENQKADLVQSQGESLARALAARDRTSDEATVVEAARAAMEAQGGNCAEHADVTYAALATRTLDAPVMRVSDSNWDHGYVVIGDPRDSRWGERHTVVVDPWPRYPTACTLAETEMGLEPAMPAIAERCPGAAPDPDAVDLMSRIQPIGTREIADLLARNNLPLIGNGLLEYIDANQHLYAEFYDQRTTAIDPSVKYTDGTFGGKTMDKITASLVDRQRIAQRALQEFGERHEGWLSPNED